LAPYECGKAAYTPYVTAKGHGNGSVKILINLKKQKTMHYKMFNKQMYLTKIVHASMLQEHLSNGWTVLYKCTWSGTFIEL